MGWPFGVPVSHHTSTTLTVPPHRPPEGESELTLPLRNQDVDGRHCLALRHLSWTGPVSQSASPLPSVCDPAQFPLRTQTRQRCGGADWTGWTATSIWPAVHVGPPSDQMENVEVAGQEATLSTPKGTTDCRIDHHSTDLKVLVLTLVRCSERIESARRSGSMR